MLGKYESVRIRNSIAEGLATGGSGMGLYMKPGNAAGTAAGREMLTFTHANRRLFDVSKPLADVGVILPRLSVQAGHRTAMDAFRHAGDVLLNDHVLMEVVADEHICSGRLDAFSFIVLPEVTVLPDRQCACIREVLAAGGTLVLLGGDADHILERELSAEIPVTKKRGRGAGRVIRLEETEQSSLPAILNSMHLSEISRIEAPWTVRVGAFHNAERIVLHLVNYNRDEARGKEVKGPAGEFPIDVRDIRVRLQLPQARQVRSVTLFRPETDRAEPLSLECRGRTLTFAVPRIAVYGVVDIRYGRSWWPF